MRILMLNYEYPPLGGGGSNACKYILAEFIHEDNCIRIMNTSNILKFVRSISKIIGMIANLFPNNTPQSEVGKTVFLPLIIVSLKNYGLWMKSCRVDWI